MANHGVGDLLNEVLHLLEERGVFRQMGLEEAQRLVLDIVKLSDWYDCRPGEILKGVGHRLKICRWCVTAQKEIIDGFCVTCRKEEGHRFL
jgi:recombinational DNA repair protein RecR